MSDLKLITCLITRTCLSLLITYATWVIVRSQLLSMSAENEEIP